MITAAGEVITEDEMGSNDHIFYIILIHNILSGRRAGGRYAIKIGKSHTARARLLSYQAAYGKQGFKVLHLRKFQKKTAHGFDVQGTHRETWADGFERKMIKTLKDMKVTPMYVRGRADEAQSVEYYYEDDEQKIFECLNKVVLELSEEIKPKKNRKSKRLQATAKKTYSLSANLAAPPNVPEAPKESSRRYQGYERYNFKDDFVK